MQVLPYAAPPPHLPPFDATFFASIFAERIRSFCEAPSDRLPIVVLHLVDGATLDLCHIELLTPRWLVVAAFRESRICEEMDAVYLPYEAILRVVLTRADARARRMGFQLARSDAALKPPV